MKSPVVKRSIVIAGHKTSVSLEDAFWKGLKEIAGERDITLSDLVAAIDSGAEARQSIVRDPLVRPQPLSAPRRRGQEQYRSCHRRPRGGVLGGACPSGRLTASARASSKIIVAPAALLRAASAWWAAANRAVPVRPRAAAVSGVAWRCPSIRGPCP